MSKKITSQELNERIKHKKCKIIESSFISMKHSAKFIDEEYGEFIAIPDKVLRRSKKHPIRSKMSQINKLRKYLTVDDINDILIKNNRKCRMIEQPFKTIDDKCIFIDEEYGEFVAIIYNVMKNTDHPKRGQEKRKQTINNLYGVDFYSQHADFKDKITQTYLSRYGVEHNMKHPKMALKNARSQNKSANKIHWKDDSDILCVGSYESSIVDYLNKNKIDFLWQPKVFILNNNQTYRPDLYLIKQGLWIEIKGYFRKDAELKWKEFNNLYPNSELWDRNKLKSLGCIFNRKGLASYG